MCAYSERPATIAAYGKLHDEQFWTDLERLQAIQKAHPNFGFFGQVLDSTDSKAIQARQRSTASPFRSCTPWTRTGRKFIRLET